MSGKREMPQPGRAWVVIFRPGNSCLYVPSVQDTESPKKVIRGASPGFRPSRCIGVERDAADTAFGSTVGIATIGTTDPRVGMTVATRTNTAVAPTTAVAPRPAAAVP